MSESEPEFEEEPSIIDEEENEDESEEEQKRPRKEKPKFSSPYNREFNSKRDLGITTFWTISLFLEVSNSEYDTQTGSGFSTGNLLEDIGPVKKGKYVQLSNDGDEVTLSLFDEDEGDWDDIYTFHVIIQKPIIVEPKRRML